MVYSFDYVILSYSLTSRTKPSHWTLDYIHVTTLLCLVELSYLGSRSTYRTKRTGGLISVLDSAKVLTLIATL